MASPKFGAFGSSIAGGWQAHEAWHVRPADNPGRTSDGPVRISGGHLLTAAQRRRPSDRSVRNFPPGASVWLGGPRARWAGNFSRQVEAPVLDELTPFELCFGRPASAAAAPVFVGLSCSLQSTSKRSQAGIPHAELPVRNTAGSAELRGGPTELRIARCVWGARTFDVSATAHPRQPGPISDRSGRSAKTTPNFAATSRTSARTLRTADGSTLSRGRTAELRT